MTLSPQDGSALTADDTCEGLPVYRTGEGGLAGSYIGYGAVSGHGGHRSVADAPGRRTGIAADPDLPALPLHQSKVTAAKRGRSAGRGASAAAAGGCSGTGAGGSAGGGD